MGPDERLFLRVVDTGSMKRVAGEIGANPSTVSRRLAALEERLGIRLLKRSTRRTTVTDAGLAYAEGLRGLVEQLDALEAQVAGAAEEPRGRLVVTAPSDFAQRFVVPVLDTLLRRAPLLEVELVLGGALFDLADRGIDVAIRIGALRDSALRARRLGAVPRMLVAAPAYLEEHGAPLHPDDLEGHRFVLYARSNAPQITLQGREGTRTVAVAGRVTVNSMQGTRAFVAAGHGISLGPRWAFDEDLAAGRVVQVLPDWISPAYPLHALFLPSRYVPAKVRAFVDAMRASTADEPTLQG